MSRPVYQSIEPGVEGWDAPLNDNFAILQGPMPMAEFGSVGALPAATQFDRCIAVVTVSGVWTPVWSDGATWRRLDNNNPV